MKKYYFLSFALIGGLFILVSCQDYSRDKVEKQVALEKRVAVLSQPLNLPKLASVSLTVSAQEKIADWSAFFLTKIEIEKLSEINLGQLAANTENLNKAMTNLESTLPKDLQVKPVIARIRVLKSLSGMLAQIANTPNFKVTEITNFAAKIPQAFENLKIQINEVYRKELDDFRAELKPEKQSEIKPLKSIGSFNEKSE